MDIAITLPNTLWDKIKSGEKKIELRKNFPTNFNLNTDRVYVCLKGTEYVVGFFKVKSYYPLQSTTLLSLDYIIKKIAVPKQWVQNYVENSTDVYLIYIDKVTPFLQLFLHRSVYNIKKNPQSFVYLK